MRIAFIVLLSLVSIARADEEILRVGLPYRDLTVTVPKLKHAPTIDGKVEPAEWAEAGMPPRLITARDDGDDRLTDLESHFYFGYTDDSVYLAFQIQRPSNALEPLAQTEKTDRDKSMWKSNDFLEFFLDNIPDIGRPMQSYRDFYFTWNLKGSRYDRTEYPIMNRGWNPEWETVSRVVPGYGWEGEVRWPLKIFEKLKGVPNRGDVWRYSLFANNATPQPSNDFSSFSLLWSSSRDFSAMRFTGDDGLVARVLDSGAMNKTHKAGLSLELLNPATSDQAASADIRLYKRKANSPSKVSYLRAFDQGRDRPEDLAGKGKVATFISDEKTSEMILSENYDLVKQTKQDVSLAAGKRQTLDALIPADPGHYLVLYEVREGNSASKDSKLVAGGALPFVVPEPLEVKTQNFTLVDRSVAVQAELKYVPNWKGEGTVAARVVSAAAPEKALFEKSWDGKGLEDQLKFDVSVNDIPPGDYRLKLAVKDSAGKELATRDASLVVPPVPQWFTEKAGNEPTIPPPWKPIKTSAADSAQKVSFLMGDYELRDSLLPSQINVRSIYEKDRKPLLRAPMRIVAKIGGKEVPISGAWKIGEAKSEHVDCRAEAKAEGLTVSNQTSFEYDGMDKSTLTIAPVGDAAAAQIDELYLEVPLRKEFSTLCTGFGGQVYEVPADGTKIAFTECVTIGNEERRFVWFAENQRGWHVSPKFAKETIELANSADGATLRVNLIKPDKPLPIDKPREIVFGFMFTPARTMPKGPMNVVYYGGNPEREAKENLVNVFERWDFYTGVQGWPEFKTPKIRTTSTADVVKTHELGAKITPYTGWFIHRAATIYPIYGDEMLTSPIVDGGVGADVVCWNTPIQDAMTGLLVERAKDTSIDGYRLDAGFQNLYKCQSLKHHGYGSTCGYNDDDGKLQGSLSIFAARKMSQRGYRIFHGGAVPDGLCLQWESAARLPPVMSHMDSCGSCEGPDTHLRAIKEIPFAYYRSIVMADALGVNCVYMPKADVIGMDTRLGNALIHNVTPRGNPGMSAMETGYSRSALSPLCVWQMRGQWIDPYAEGTEFFGYWKDAKLVQTDSDDRKASLYVRRGEKVLLAVLNLERKPVESEIKLNLAELGFKEAFAQDAVTGEELAMENGALKLDITPEGFRAVKITSTKQPSTVPQKSVPNLISEMEPDKFPASGLPSGWAGQRGGAQVDNGQLSVTTGTLLTKTIKLEKGKTYLLEAEARVDCEDGAMLGQQIQSDLFRISLGAGDRVAKQSMSSQLPAGKYRTLRAVCTPPASGDGSGNVEIYFGNGKGKAELKRIGLYEVSAK